MKIAPDISSHVSSEVDVKKQAKLVDAAQQFEAMMLQEMLKPMRGGKDSWGGEESDSNDSASDTISSFGTEAFAKAISKGGGFGIARQIISKVSLEHQKHSEKNK
jgi:flagellar protein FlgJ